MYDLSAVVAVDVDYGIGLTTTNTMPWLNDKEDMAWFRSLTVGHTIIMGWKTWESLGRKPLPLRHNVVLTKKHVDNMGGPVTFVQGDNDLLHATRAVIVALRDAPDKRLFVIGGAKTYSLFAPITANYYVTRFKFKSKADVFFDGNLLTGTLSKTIKNIENGVIVKYEKDRTQF